MPNRQKTWIRAFGYIFLMVSTSAWAAPVPDTGQTKCYNATVEIPCPSPGQPFYGQDANYTINPMSYTKLDGGGNALSDSSTSWVMVKDNVTGLIWEMKTNKDSVKNYNDPHDTDNTYTWYDSNSATNGGYSGTPGNGTTEDFINALNNAKYGGYSDWRMPSIKELNYIANYCLFYRGPTNFDTYFPNTGLLSWSSTTYAGIKSFAFDVSLDFAFVGLTDKKNNNNAQAVRGGQSESLGNSVIEIFDTLESRSVYDAAAAGSYTDNGDGTVTDTSTDLMWEQAGYSNRKSWEQALAYCEGLNLGGHTDWRLPTIKELRSLMDYSRYNPVINTTYFPNTVAAQYWSSTTSVSTESAWYMDFSNGFGIFGKKYENYYARAVRGGQAVASTPPALDIKVNGQDGQITVSSGTPVSITASLAPGNENGKLADWWLAGSTPWGWYSLDSNGWTLGINLLAQYPLFSIEPVNIFYSALPAGDYAFYFLVDTNPNGNIDEPFYYDVVQVHVTE